MNKIDWIEQICNTPGLRNKDREGVRRLADHIYYLNQLVESKNNIQDEVISKMALEYNSIIENLHIVVGQLTAELEAKNLLMQNPKRRAREMTKTKQFDTYPAKIISMDEYLIFAEQKIKEASSILRDVAVSYEFVIKNSLTSEDWTTEGFKKLYLIEVFIGVIEKSCKLLSEHKADVKTSLQDISFGRIAWTKHDKN